MKKILYFTVIFTFLSVSCVLANDTEPKSTKALTSQIYNLFAEENVPDQIRGQKAEVRLAVDDKGLVRILSISTNSSLLSEYIKENIDFQELRKGSYDEGIVYLVPIEVAK
ncbi:hypothetical protein SAMN04488008_104212 [Maribacter orientalis]|uniref:TonB protein C-terminal n=1 Tax=Maribacter orientalis TaxID=228957 RepID=A0A1H7R8N7_9FLAO|nr:hypothetical protein [Maribacter orientalis]SEL56553.1 hypothetical protein SAMN04488008_104212 [Maribacter orientalis]